MPNQRPAPPRSTEVNHWRRSLAALVFAAAVVAGITWQIDRAQTHPLSPPSAPTKATAGRATNQMVPSHHGALLAEGADGAVKGEERAEQAGVDASLLYKDAFALYAALTEDQKKMLGEPVDNLQPDKAAELCELINPIVELLCRAAEADYCDWAIGPLALDMRLTHVTKGQELGRLARWHADYLFPSDPAQALEALSAQARLGEHLSDSLIGWLVQTSFERGAVKVIRENIEHMEDPERSHAQEFLRTSSLGEGIARAFAGEVQGLETLAAQLARQTPSERLEQLSMLGLPARPAESGEAGSNAALEDGEYFVAEIRYLQDLQRQIPEAIRWPDAQFQSWWKSIQDTIRTEHPFAATILPSLTMVQSRFQQSQVERAMLDAGLGVLRAEPPDRVRDPFSGNAFSYARTNDGFELRSTFQVQGKPLTMSFPPAQQ